MSYIKPKVDRWKNRRTMAWLSLWAGLGFPLLVLFTESDTLGNIAGPFYLLIGSVIGAYIGFATVDDKWQALHETQTNEPNFEKGNFDA